MRAIALLSGGLDSTVATWWALDQGWDVTALTLNYFQRPPPEIQGTREIAELAGIDLLEVEAPWMRELDDPPHPLLDNPALDRAPYGYVPGRNAILYATAAHHAEIIGAERIVGGHNGVDPDTFPDAAPGFFEELAELLAKGLATEPDLAIEQPLIGLDKHEVVSRGLELGAPMRLSWSCYELGPDPCQACPSCQAREQAFDQLGLADPARATAGCS